MRRPLVHAAALAAAAFFPAACGKGGGERDAAAIPAGPRVEWWGDTAEAVFPTRGMRAFGATWGEVTGALGRPGFLQLETGNGDTTFLAGYQSWHTGISDSMVALMFEFHSTGGGARKLARVYWRLRDNGGDRMLPDTEGKVRDLVRYLTTTWGGTLAEVEAALGPGFRDTSSGGQEEGVEDEGEHSGYPTRRYPGLEFTFLDDGTLFAMAWSDPVGRLPHGLRLGMTRHQILRLMGLPWLAHNDPRGVQRDGPETNAGSAARNERGDFTVTWQYVPDSTDDYFNIVMLRDTVRSVEWWTPLNH